jgi:hypothetical protein
MYVIRLDRKGLLVGHVTTSRALLLLKLLVLIVDTTAPTHLISIPKDQTWK